VSPPRPHLHNPGDGAPGPAHWLYSAEEILPLAAVGRLIEKIGRSLEESGGIKLRDDLEVNPPDPCTTIVRFERTSKGHFKLLVELKWGREDRAAENGDRLADLIDEDEFR
jgi:hypothetical protein